MYGKPVDKPVQNSNTVTRHRSSEDALNQVCTTSDAARRYHYTRRTVTAWCEAGYIDACLSGGRWIISEKSLQSFLEKRAKRHKRAK